MIFVCSQILVHHHIQQNEDFGPSASGSGRRDGGRRPGASRLEGSGGDLVHVEARGRKRCHMLLILLLILLLVVLLDSLPVQVH